MNIHTVIDYTELAILDAQYPLRGVWQEGCESVKFAETQTGKFWGKEAWILLFILEGAKVTCYVLFEEDLRGEQGRVILAQHLGHE